MHSLLKASILGIALVGLVACGDDKKTTGGGPAPAPAPAPDAGAGGGGGGGQKYEAAKHTASLSGTVKFNGTRPELRMLPIAKDPFCVDAWKDKNAVDQRFEINEDGTVPNVLVSAKDGAHTAFKFDPPTDRDFQVVQHNCYYEPHVFAVMAGESFSVHNADQTPHNVRQGSKRNGEKNLAQNPGQTDKFAFAKKEAKIPFACDIHSWMSAWAFVFEHPFHAVTDATGKFEIKGLPAGEYTFKAWHEELGDAEFKVTIAEGQAASQEVGIGK